MAIIKSYCKNFDIIIDDEDFKEVSKYNWSVNFCKSINKYRHPRSCIKNKVITLHRFIKGEPPIKGLVMDHINRNKLDNRKQNLRWVTHSQNHINRDPDPRNKTGYRGISKAGNKFIVHRAKGYKTYHMTIEEAVKAKEAWVSFKFKQTF